jgi:hypothetical protein
MLAKIPKNEDIDHFDQLLFMYQEIKEFTGLRHAISKAFSRWLPTTAARIRPKVNSCGNTHICG